MNKFHKAVQRYYLSKAENADITSWQISNFFKTPFIRFNQNCSNLVEDKKNILVYFWFICSTSSSDKKHLRLIESSTASVQTEVNKLTALSTAARQSMRVCNACIASSNSSKFSGMFAKT